MTDEQTRSVSASACGDERTVGRRCALLYQCRKAADKVHACRIGGTVERTRGFQHPVSAQRAACNGDRCDGYALIDDGDAQFFFDFLADRNEPFSALGDFVIDARRKNVRVIGSAVEQ